MRARESYGGVSTAAPDSLLTTRAFEYLAAGPSDVCSLVSHICNLPGAPFGVAEHIAASLFRDDTRFVRESDGRWRLAVAEEAPSYRIEASLDELRALSYVVVDVETTGCRAFGGDRITEVAAVRVCGGQSELVFNSLVNPERPIPSYISALTNITWEMVKDAPTFRDVCRDLLGVLEGNVFVAHNANFDWRFVSMEVERVTGRVLEGRRLCTVKLARRLLPQLRRRSLDYVTAHYGVEITDRHRAGGDALATARVLVRLLDDARDRGCVTWSDLQQMTGAATRAKRKRRRSAMPSPVDKDTTA